MLNHIIIMGRLTRDPEMRQAGGTSVVRFSVAVDRDYKDKNTGNAPTDFINCEAWGVRAEHIVRFFQKGSMIIVEGRLQVDEWTDKDGNRQWTTRVKAESTHFGESRREADARRSGGGGGGYDNSGGSYGGNSGGGYGNSGGGYGGNSGGGYGNSGGGYGGNSGGGYGNSGGGYGGNSGGGYGGNSGGDSGGYNAGGADSGSTGFSESGGSSPEKFSSMSEEDDKNLPF